MYLYVDGAQIGSNTGSRGVYPFDNYPLFIGAVGAGNSQVNPFNGKIDEVAIFNRALNSTEISALYGGTSPNIYPSNLIASNLNPIAYYPLGEQAQNTGYLGNEITNGWQFPNGVLQDYVMDFNAANYISTSHISLSSAFSASAWVNTTDTSTYGNIFSSDQAPVGGAIRNWQLVKFNATARFILRNSSGGSIADAYDLNVVINDGKWHHILATWDGTTGTNKVKIYIDGDLAAQDTASSTSLRNDTVLMIMGGSSATWDFIGKISNVAIWNSDQSTNVANIYNNGSPQTSYTVSPQNWWKLNATSVYTPSAPNYTKALDFVTSESDYIDLGTTTAYDTGDLSAAIWVNISNNGGTQYIFSNSGSSSFLGFDVKVRGSNEIGVSRSSQLKSSTSGWINVGFVYDIWQHLAFTFNYATNTIKLFLNGELKDTSIGVTESTSLASRKLTIGSYKGTGSFTNGKISNASIWNTTLTESQISTLFNFGTPETNISFNPVAWWKLDDQTAITDSSGNGNTGTNNGATDISSGVAVTPSWKIPTALPCLLYTSPSPRDRTRSRMPSSA